MIQLQKQALSLKELLKQRSHSPPTPSKIMLDQIIKECAVTMHNAAILAQENANLRASNKKIVKKRTRSTKQIPYKEGLTTEEGL